ncbi:MAG: hypothetical protein R3C28_09385 [Pirellulaceae bacterium]
MNVESLESRLALSFGFGGVHLDRPAGEMGHFGDLNHKIRSDHSPSRLAESQQRMPMPRGGLSDQFHAGSSSKRSFDRPGLPPPLVRLSAAAPEVNHQDQAERNFLRDMQPVVIRATNVVVISVSIPKYQRTVAKPLYTNNTVASATSLPAAVSLGPAFSSDSRSSLLAVSRSVPNERLPLAPPVANEMSPVRSERSASPVNSLSGWLATSSAHTSTESTTDENDVRTRGLTLVLMPDPNRLDWIVSEASHDTFFDSVAFSLSYLEADDAASREEEGTDELVLLGNSASEEVDADQASSQTPSEYQHSSCCTASNGLVQIVLPSEGNSPSNSERRSEHEILEQVFRDEAVFDIPAVMASEIDLDAFLLTPDGQDVHSENQLKPELDRPAMDAKEKDQAPQTLGELASASLIISVVVRRDRSTAPACLADKDSALLASKRRRRTVPNWPFR